MFEKFASAVLLAVGAIGQMVYPGDNCCTFYSLEYYGGTPHTVCHEGVAVTHNVSESGLGWG